MLPFGVPAGFCFLPLFADVFLAKSAGVRVVCIGPFFGGGVFVLVLGDAFFGAVLMAMGAPLDEERGGEGGRPVDGVNRDVSGSVRFSRGFLNMGVGFQQRYVSTIAMPSCCRVAHEIGWRALASSRAKTNASARVGAAFQPIALRTSTMTTYNLSKTHMLAAIEIRHRDRGFACGPVNYSRYSL